MKVLFSLARRQTEGFKPPYWKAYRLAEREVAAVTSTTFYKSGAWSNLSRPRMETNGQTLDSISEIMGRNIRKVRRTSEDFSFGLIYWL